VQFLKKKALVFVQILLILGSAFLLYSKLGNAEIASHFADAFAVLTWWHIAIVLLLSIINWLFDTRVWQLILKPFVKVEFSSALRINVIAQSAGAITPLAVGDYGLRSYLLKDKIEARQNALLSLTYRLVKMAVRIVMGLLCIFYVSISQDLVLLGVALAIGLLAMSFISIRAAILYVSKSKSANKILNERERIDFSKINLTRVFVPGVLLFAAYSLQTSVLIFWMSQSAPFMDILLWVVITYSITSFLPATGVFDPMIKSAFGALFALQLAAAPAIILFAFTTTWLFNLGVPGFISSLLFRKLIGKAYRTTKSTR
jgi:hypothetical protein